MCVNDIYTVEISGMTDDGRGVGRAEGVANVLRAVRLQGIDEAEQQCDEHHRRKPGRRRDRHRHRQRKRQPHAQHADPAEHAQERDDAPEREQSQTAV